MQNQPYPYDALVKLLNINSNTNLFDVMFTYQNNQENILKLDNTETQIVEINNNIAKFNLSLEIKPKSHSINIEYCTDLFKKETIERLFEHYMNAIDFIMKDINVQIKDIEIISESEKNKILCEFNDTKMEYPKDKTIIELFENQVQKNKNVLAVVQGDFKITYKELEEKSNYVAQVLQKNGIKNGDVVGVCLNRSIELIISIIGILKIGAIYMPIYIDYPRERKEYMLQDSNAKVLITQNDETYQFNGIVYKIENWKKIIEKKEIDFKSDVKADNIAYIIYTSGSTGRPKGVQIRHNNLVNFIYAFNQYYKNNIGRNK